jgi:uncharacterized protein (TIGR02284 family)
MAMDDDDVIDVLNNLIETCKDGENGFRTCAEDVKSPELKQIFNTASRRCAEAARELKIEVHQLGGKPEDSGSVSGAMHRGWVNVKAAIVGKDEQAVLAECERGEDVAKVSYEKALKQDLPPHIRALVERQYRGVLENHNRVRNLELAAKATH